MNMGSDTVNPTVRTQKTPYRIEVEQSAFEGLQKALLKMKMMK